MGQGPDIIYAEPGQTEYMDNGLLLDLGDKLDWDNTGPWAKAAWGHDGGVYGFSLGA